MPRSKAGVKRGGPDLEKLRSAIKLIKEKRMTLHGAAKHTGVARSTIRRHMNKILETGDENYSLRDNNSTHKVFNHEEELMLLEYIKEASILQYGLTLQNVRKLAYTFASENKKNAL